MERAADLPLRKFSRGMLQRVGLAQALINDPPLVILDEPLGGLDPLGRKEIRDIILGLRDEGKTVFFTSHILQDIEMICDRVAIIVGGRILSQGGCPTSSPRRSCSPRSRSPGLRRVRPGRPAANASPTQGGRALLKVFDEAERRGRPRPRPGPAGPVHSLSRGPRPSRTSSSTW